MKIKKVQTHPDCYSFSKPYAIDGDTFRCLVECGFGIHSEQRIRVKGFYAPEIDGMTPDLGLAAKQRLQEFLEASQLFIRAWGMKMDRYGRTVAELWWPDRAVTAFEVLGTLQLTVEEHRRDLAIAKMTPQKSKQIHPERGGQTGLPL